MTTIEILTITAIILGPIFAVQIEKYLNRIREDKNRRLSIFKTLMATRGSGLAAAHVEALNRIDLEFSGNKKYLKVISTWKEYFDNLSQRFEGEDQLKAWILRNEELLANLLFEMGHSLGYDFDKILIKRNVYSPVGHVKVEQEFQLIRQSIISLLQGENPLPININHLEIGEEALARQTELQALMIEYYKKGIGK